MIKTNSIKAWLLAARLHTLSGAAMPVGIGMALAWTDMMRNGDTSRFSLTVMILAFLFAFIMQIDANIINDYFDFKRGNDKSELRKGPKRACTEGWVTPSAMRKAIALVTVCGALTGLPLAFIGGYEMIVIGVLCIAGAFLYTTHLSYIGMGDVLCLLFFGLVPVCVPYYIQTGTMTVACLSVGLAAGVVIDVMMMANNYRDIATDTAAGKRTLFVMLGARRSRLVFASAGIIAILLNIPLAMNGHPLALLLPVLTFLPMHFFITNRVYKIRQGAELYSVLVSAARNIIVYGLSTIVGVLC